MCGSNEGSINLSSRGANRHLLAPNKLASAPIIMICPNSLTILACAHLTVRASTLRVGRYGLHTGTHPLQSCTPKGWAAWARSSTGSALSTAANHAGKGTRGSPA